MRQWLRSKREATVRTYRSDLADFAAWAGHESVDGALAWALGHDAAELNAIVLGYRDDLMHRDVGNRRDGLAPSTINRRLAALRSFAKLARTVGYTTAVIEIPGVKHRKYRNTAGVGHAAYLRMLAPLEEEAENSPAAARDALVVRLLHDVGLRRSEVCRLELRDCDRAKQTIFVLGKTEDLELEVTEDVWLAYDVWLEWRGPAEGALVTTSRIPDGGVADPQPVDVSTINRIVSRAAEAVGVEGAHPHGFRHSATTALLDRLDGDVRRVKGWSRHADLGTVLIYDDQRRRDVRHLQSLISAPHPRKKKT